MPLVRDRPNRWPAVESSPRPSSRTRGIGSKCGRESFPSDDGDFDRLLQKRAHTRKDSQSEGKRRIDGVRHREMLVPGTGAWPLKLCSSFYYSSFKYSSSNGIGALGKAWAGANDPRDAPGSARSTQQGVRGAREPTWAATGHRIVKQSGGRAPESSGIDDAGGTIAGCRRDPAVHGDVGWSFPVQAARDRAIRHPRRLLGAVSRET